MWLLGLGNRRICNERRHLIRGSLPHVATARSPAIGILRWSSGGNQGRCREAIRQIFSCGRPFPLAMGHPSRGRLGTLPPPRTLESFQEVFVFERLPADGPLGGFLLWSLRSSGCGSRSGEKAWSREAVFSNAL